MFYHPTLFNTNFNTYKRFVTEWVTNYTPVTLWTQTSREHNFVMPGLLDTQIKYHYPCLKQLRVHLLTGKEFRVLLSGTILHHF